MPQRYDQLGYIPNILAIILLKTPYFDPKKITRASFLFVRAKFIGIRSVVDPFRSNKRNPDRFRPGWFRLDVYGYLSRI